MDAIIVLPYLTALVVGYAALVIFTICAVTKSVNRHRLLANAGPTAPTPPLLTPGAIVLGVSTLIVTAGILLITSNQYRPDEGRGEADLIGAWTSVSKDAPGELTLLPGGQAELDGMTPLATIPMSRQPEEAWSGSGQWLLDGSDVRVQARNAAGESRSWDFIVMTSWVRGTSLQIVVGDPEEPDLQQVFRRED